MKPSILKKTVLNLFHKGHSKNLSELIGRVHPVDMALVFPGIRDKERKVFFDQIIDNPNAAKILSEMTDKKLIIKILNGLDHKRIGEIFHHMEPDDAADILGYLPVMDAEAILRLMQREDSIEINKLLRYEPDTAGGMMTPSLVSFHADTDVDDAIKKLKKNRIIDHIIYVYVVDKDSRLLGYLPLNDLLLFPGSTKMGKVINENTFYVKTHIPINEVLRIVNKYHLLELPVVSKGKQLVGVITSDDVMDIMKHENSQKLLKDSGVSYIDDPINASIWEYFKTRSWWLFFCFFAGIATALATQEITEIPINTMSYITMIPLVIMMSVVSSIQTSAATSRNIFLGKLDGDSKIKVLYKEMKLSIIMGIIFGVMSGGFNFGFNQNPKLSCVVALSVFALFPVSTLIGFIMPVLMTRIKRRPSTSFVPFTATVSSLVNVCLYLLISTNLMAIDIIARI
ncbi:MAG: CBS domain-containing protein [Proteobacteria bacterium]|nr:CBS domain-containing protein [Pseudomonadota bacterium]